MFSAFRKLAGRNGGEEPSSAPQSRLKSLEAAAPGAFGSTMDPQLQKKFGRGVHYNMKLILKGDRNTGKSCLFQRLQGKPFVEQYAPTDEIQVASLQWNYKAADDIVKVEVWDVVDKSPKRRKANFDGLKLNNSPRTASSPECDMALDAEWVDVYKGTNAVVFLYDVTKQWTFEYVQREIGNVPVNVSVLIMANFIDMGHHGVVTRDQALGFVEEEREKRAAPANTDGARDVVAEIRYVESSMRNGFGLKLLHEFLNLPFLMLQRESLLTQLAVNRQEMEAASYELDLYFESDEANYEIFSETINQKRRINAESLAPRPSSNVTVARPKQTVDRRLKMRETKMEEKEESSKKGLKALQAVEAEQEKYPVDQVDRKDRSEHVSRQVDVHTGGRLDAFVPLTDPEGINDFLDSEDVTLPRPLEVLGSDPAINRGGSDSDSETGGNPMVARIDDNSDIEIEDSPPSLLVPKKGTVNPTYSPPSDSENDGWLPDASKNLAPITPPSSHRSRNSMSPSRGDGVSVKGEMFDMRNLHPGLEPTEGVDGGEGKGSLRVGDESSEDPGSRRNQGKQKKKKKKKTSSSSSTATATKKNGSRKDRERVEEFLHGVPHDGEVQNQSGIYEEL